MSEARPFAKNLLWFIIGGVATAALFYGLVIPEVKRSRTNDEALSKHLQTVQANLQQEIEHWRQEAIFQVRDGKPVTWREEAQFWIKEEARCEAKSR